MQVLDGCGDWKLDQGANPRSLRQRRDGDAGRGGGSPVSPGARPLRPAPELGWLHRTEWPWPRGAASGCASFFASIRRGGGAGSRQAGAFAWGTARKERPPRRGATGREVVAHDLPHARTEAMIQHRAVANGRRRSGRWSSSSWATSMPPAVPRHARPTRIGRRVKHAYAN